MGSSYKDGREKKSRKKYSKEFKLEAVRLTKQPGMSTAKVAQDLGLSQTMLANWIRSLSADGSDAFRGNGKRSQLDAENAVLKRKIRVLEEERDILKRAAT